MKNLSYEQVLDLIDLVRNNNEFEDDDETIAYWDGVLDSLYAELNDES
jgi:hypothetical protein